MPIKSHISDVEAFLKTARERYAFGLAADKEDREIAADDSRFAAGEQWSAEARTAREKAERPVLTWNRIPTFIAQIANDGRQNKPAIKTAAMDGGKPETAEFFQSRIRQVEYDSNADIAYDTARDQQVTTGRAAIRISTEWIPGTFQQRACIDPIENQFSVVWDPGGREYARTDGEWCFVISHISKEEHDRRFGEDTKASTAFAGSSADNPAPDWIGVGEKGEMIQIADYYAKEHNPRRLCLVSGVDGVPTAKWKDELPPGFSKELILVEREDDDVAVWYYTINGAEILEETEWIDHDIPIVPLWGREAVVDGKRRTFSLIRNAKDPQRSVNVIVSNIAELIAQMPKVPWMAPVGAIPANLIADWEKANNLPVAFLLYKQYDQEGKPLEKPFRIQNEPPIQALTIALQQAIDGIKAAMGIYDASIGARSNETSGIAIQRRQKESDVANFHFADNEARTRKQIGSILLRLIPQLDKNGSSVPVRSEDGKTQLVPLGQTYNDPKTGKPVIHDLSTGEYGVSVETGPSYTSQRQELQERDSQLIQAVPELMWIFGDQYFAADDTPGSQDRAERMKQAITMRSPGLIKEPGQQQPLPPEVQQAMQQMQQKLAQTEAFAQSLHQKLETKQPELENAVKLKQMDLDFQREKLGVDSTTKVAIEEFKLGVTTDLEALHAELDILKHERGISAQEQAADADRQHAADMSDQQHAQALEQKAAEPQRAAQ